MKSRKRFESCHSGNANFDAADLNDANRDRAVARSTRPFSASLADLPVGYLLRLSLWGNSLLSKRPQCSTDFGRRVYLLLFGRL